MRIAVTCRTDLDGQKALKEYAKEKVEKLEHLYPRPMTAHVVLAKERFTHVAELTLTVDGEALACLAKDEDGRASIDAAIAKAAARLRRLKGRRTDHRPPEARRADRVRRAKVAPKDAVVVTPPAPAFVPVEAAAGEPMTVELAIATLEAQKLPLLLFKNARSKRANVVYRMPDGRIGLVEATARSK